MRTLIITGLVLLAANCLHAQMIDDFSGDVSVWKPEMQYGDVTGCEAGPGPGNGEGKSLQIDYVFADAGTNHIIYARPWNSTFPGPAACPSTCAGRATR